MKKIIAPLLGILCLATVAEAQYMQDVNGRVVTEMTYTDVEGSPFLVEEFHKGIVTMVKDNQVHDGVPIRYDAYKDELEYEKDGKHYRLGPEVMSFSIPTGDALYEFQRGFPAAGDLTENSFYQVLHDGNTKLLKHYGKRMREEKAYNSASATKRFDDSEQLFVLKGGKMNPVKKNGKKDLLALLSDEKNLMNYVIKEEQLDFKSEMDMVKLLEEYDAYKAGRKSKN